MSLAPLLGGTAWSRIGRRRRADRRAAAASRRRTATRSAFFRPRPCDQSGIYPITGFDPKKSLAPVTKAFYLTQVFAVTASVESEVVRRWRGWRKPSPNSDLHVARRCPRRHSWKSSTGSTASTWSASVQRRRRCRQQHDDRHHAGRDFRHRQPGPVDPRRQIIGLAVDGDKRSPLAPEIPTFRRSAIQRILPATFFGIYAPTGTPKPISTNFRLARQGRLQPGIPEAPHDIRAHLPLCSTRPQFRQGACQERAEGLDAVKASGLYPT